MIGSGLSFRDVPVTWRGQPALAQARRIGNKIQVSSLRVPGVRDAAGREKDEVFAAVPPGEKDAVAFEGVPAEERFQLLDQVAAILG